MWDWEVVDEVEPIVFMFSNPWELLLRYAYIAMLCSQTWIGFERIHDRCEMLILKVETLIHIWVD